MRVGITTTVPVEVIFAAGAIPVDLNNIFITSSDPDRYVEAAQGVGFPRSICSWIKAQHTVVSEGGFDRVIAVTTGDCSNTHAMVELFADAGVCVHRFAYPSDNTAPRAYAEIRGEIMRMAEFMGVGENAVLAQFERLKSVRAKLKMLDQLTVDGFVTGGENHIWLVSSSDFNGDPDKFEKDLDGFLTEAAERKPVTGGVRLGFAGVPPIISDLYEYVEKAGARFVFNEVQRQFSIPSENPDYYRRYLDYSYPYDIFYRINDIKREIASRRIHGMVHYVQSFCHRQIQDILVKRYLPVPVLTIEADAPGALDERSKIRIESFIEMLSSRK